MNTTDCCLDSTLNEIIDIFKEMSMEVKIVKIEKMENKFGVRKILTDASGNQYKVSTKQRFYDDCVAPGIYDITMSEYMGKPCVKWVTYKGIGSDGSATPTATRAAQSIAKAASGSIGMEERLRMDKLRQDDIRLEFYCGLVKDVMIANKKEGEDISLDAIQLEAKKLYLKHQVLLGMTMAEEKKPEPEPEEPAPSVENYSGEAPF